MPNNSKNKMTSGDNYLRISSLRYLPRWMVFLIDVCILFISLGIAFYILNKITAQAFGNFGRSLLGVIVSLACLTTAIGLIVSVSEYFNEIYHKISYKTYVIIFTLIGFIIANQGLSAVISKSVPILLVLYPISMTIILLLSVNIFVKVPLVAQRLSIALTTLVSIGSVAGLEQANNLPLKDYSMEWIPFAVTGALLGCLIHVFYKSES